MLKKSIIRLLLVIFVLAALSLACNRPTRESAIPTVIPMTEEEMQQLQNRLEETLANSSGSFTVTLTQQQINSIIAAKLAEQTEQIITEPAVVLTNGNMEISGKISQAGLAIKMNMVLRPSIDTGGKSYLEVVQMGLGGIPVPGELQDQVSSLINEALTDYLASEAAGFQLGSITIEEGQMTVTGTLP